MNDECFLCGRRIEGKPVTAYDAVHRRELIFCSSWCRDMQRRRTRKTRSMEHYNRFPRARSTWIQIARAERDE